MTFSESTGSLPDVPGADSSTAAGRFRIRNIRLSSAPFCSLYSTHSLAFCLLISKRERNVACWRKTCLHYKFYCYDYSLAILQFKVREVVSSFHMICQSSERVCEMKRQLPVFRTLFNILFSILCSGGMSLSCKCPIWLWLLSVIIFDWSYRLNVLTYPACIAYTIFPYFPSWLYARLLWFSNWRISLFILNLSSVIAENEETASSLLHGPPAWFLAD